MFTESGKITGSFNLLDCTNYADHAESIFYFWHFIRMHERRILLSKWSNRNGKNTMKMIL